MKHAPELVLSSNPEIRRMWERGKGGEGERGRAKERERTGMERGGQGWRGRTEEGECERDIDMGWTWGG